MNLHHISHSQIEKYLMCPYQYSLKYLEGKFEWPSSNLIQGSAYHSALEHNFTAKLGTERDLPLDVILDVYSDKLDEGIFRAQALFKTWNPEPHLKDQGIGLVKAYMTTISPGVIPIEVEKWIEVPIGDILIQCRIDLIDENFIVIDHKTAAQVYDQEKADSLLQFSAEAFVLRAPIDCEVHVALKYKNPRIDIIKTSRTVEDILWWRKLAGHVIRGIQNDVFPMNPYGWWCDSKYCGFYEDCKKGTTAYR